MAVQIPYTHYKRNTDLVTSVSEQVQRGRRLRGAAGGQDASDAAVPDQLPLPAGRCGQPAGQPVLHAAGPPAWGAAGPRGAAPAECGARGPLAGTTARPATAPPGQDD